MKKFIATTLVATMAISSVACGDTTKTDSGKTDTTEPTTKTETKETTETTETTEPAQTLKVWSFTNEAQVFVTAFEEATGVDVEFTMVPMTNGDYQQKLQQTLANGTDVPDVIFLENSFLRQYIESPYLADLSDLLPKAKELETYQFTIDAGTYEGQTKAFSYQAAPGGVFYRRSLAKEYFGTDEPDKIQAMMSDIQGYTKMAETIKEKSGGNTYIVSSTGDFKKGFTSGRTQPWIVDNKLVIDPMVKELFETSKLFRENGYEAQAVQWEDSWFSGMNDTLTGADGTAKQVFSYWLPTWGLPYTLMPNAKTETTDTSGDWAVIRGPLSYDWGGTWIAAAKDAENPELAKDFVEFATLNEDTLTKWATGVYTNEYLKAVDSTLSDDIKQGPGDFVSSDVVVQKIKDQFNDAETSAFVGGQNSYDFFGVAAPNVSLALMQGTDDVIDRTIQDSLEAYASGLMTYDEAIQQFKDNLQAVLPDLIIE